MPFPIVAVAVGAVAAASLPYLLYGQVAYFPSDDPTGMDPATLKSVNDALMSVHQKLVEISFVCHDTSYSSRSIND